MRCCETSKRDLRNNDVSLDLWDLIVGANETSPREGQMLVIGAEENTHAVLDAIF
jgi:hypothetical protein